MGVAIDSRVDVVEKKFLEAGESPMLVLPQVRIFLKFVELV